MNDPLTYAGQPICPRCGSGWPNCVDLHLGRGMDSDQAHRITCARYHWSPDTCGRCSLELAWYSKHPAASELEFLT